MPESLSEEFERLLREHEIQQARGPEIDRIADWDARMEERETVALASRAVRDFLYNHRRAIAAALAFAESHDIRGEWANLTEEGECCSCGRKIADDMGELTHPHADDCAFHAYRAVLREEGR